MSQFTTADMNVCQIEAHGLVAAAGSDSRPSVSVWNYRRTAITAPISKAAIEAAWQASVGVKLCDCLNNRYTQAFNLCRIVNDATDPNIQVTRALPGTVTGDSMSTISAAYLLFRSALRGKGLKGSKHLFPVSESGTTAATSDIWNSGMLVLLGNLAAAHIAGFTDSNGNIWVPTILRRGKKYSQLTKNNTVVIVQDVASVVINKRVAKMNKRYVRSIY